ncbi:hypothetical protein [Hymenobacter ruricola]|uniref:Uncharacterized protein n=1 Tax=Hymenobacter ruricola TaxID=2791023 RepID=A0ABS0I690_9BACT|nr:hypothetical protein [Hymenobacter ruricola]MBF9222409.1 hypothetical protein [Hymenobacter ruricola]
MTRAEELLAELCERSFLSLWSYPSPYKDQGRKSLLADGKELCDLLVIFDNHVVIFSSKECAYKSNDNAILNWTRWYRSAVADSVKQLYGAEHWLRTQPHKVYLDKTCQHRLPVPLPTDVDMRVHRIAVAHGASQACYDAHGGTGALLIDSRIIGSAHSSSEAVPFAIGQINPEKGFVHVLDDTTLFTVLQSLDTISDFINYLHKKEELFQRPNFAVLASGEDDLLAYYLRNIDKQIDQHYFPVKEGSKGLGLRKGFWDDFINSPQFQRKREADRVSYSWDKLIEHVWERTRKKRMKIPQEQWQEESILRLLAKESRINRRFLSKAFIEVIKRSMYEQRSVRVIEPIRDDRKAYVFMLLREQDDLSESYYKIRQEMLQAYCLVVKYLFYNQVDYIVGIAAEGGGYDVITTYDFVVRFGGSWEEGEKEQAEYFHQNGFLQEMRRTHWEEKEYPSE